MTRFVGLLSALLIAFVANTQTVFFTSGQQYSKELLSSFFSSLMIKDNRLYFNAPDYKLYAYDKTTGLQQWAYDVSYKSNIPPAFVQGSVWVTGRDHVLQLDAATGERQKDINIAEMMTEPVIRDGILYGTGIYDGGCVFAYDLQKDTVIWKRFLGHGCSRQPYYFADKIVANGEGNYWLEVKYSGSLVQAGCEQAIDEGNDIFPSELPCVKTFTAFTHDGKQIKGKLAEKIETGGYETTDIVTGAHHTFVLTNSKLYVIGDRLKLKSETDFSVLNDSLDLRYEAYEKILAAQDDKVWLMAGDYLFVYNFKKKTLEKSVSLKQWEPHQAILEHNKLWLISRKNGLLYGIDIP